MPLYPRPNYTGGDVTTTDDLTVGDDAHVVGDLTVDLTTTLTGAVLASSTVHVVGAVTLDGAVTLGDAAGDAITSTGNFTASGTSHLVGAVTMDGAVTLGDAAGDAITVNGTPTFNTDVTVAAAKALAVTTADKFTVGGDIIPHQFHVGWGSPAGAAAGDYDTCFFTANEACQIVAVRERHQTAGSDGGAVTLMVKKVASGTAKASGTDTLSAGISLKGTADTNASGALHGTVGNLQLAIGDSLAVVLTGTPTSVDGVFVSVWLKRI